MSASSIPPVGTQPKPGCVVSFLVLLLLASIAAWIWSFYPPMPSESDLTEVKGTVEKWEEQDVRLRKNMIEHELHLRLAGQKPGFLVERYGYDSHFKRDAAPAAGTALTLLVEKEDWEKPDADTPVRIRALRSETTAYFTLDDYRAGVKERRGWGWAFATACTAFTLFAFERVLSRRKLIFANS
jgi:hypothetical protein